MPAATDPYRLAAASGVVSRAFPRTARQLAPVSALTIAWLTAFAAGVLAAGLASVAAGGNDRVFVLATNVLFVAPAALAAHVRARAIAVAALVVLVVSSLHHGCVHEPAHLYAGACRPRTPCSLTCAHRYSLRATPFFVIAVAFLGYAVARGLDRARGEAAVAVLVAVGALVAALVATGTGAYNGCAYIYAVPLTSPAVLVEPVLAHALGVVWCIVDDTAATALALAALLESTRALNDDDDGLDGGADPVFWPLVALALVAHAFEVLVHARIYYLFFALAAGAVLVARTVRAAPRCGAHLLEAGAALALVVVAVLDFAIAANFWTHGVWHVLAALALSVLLDASRARRQRRARA